MPGFHTGFFSKRGENHLTPPPTRKQCLLPMLRTRIHLSKMFLNRCIPFCCNSSHFAAVYDSTCADLKGGGGFSKGGGEGEISLSPFPLYESLSHNTASVIDRFRQALTEISVLSDVIQIAQHQQKYVALDPVVTTPSGSASPAYQYFVKKKSLGMAAEILHRGTKSLSQASTEKEREFHKALSSLRQRWRLKRIGSGAIIGDLSYHSGNYTYH